MEITRGKLEAGQQIALFSDLHIGSADVDYRRLKEDLRDAAYDGCRININGDVMDLILPGDRKRYKPESLHHRIRGRTDTVNATVDFAADLLGPYADCIDMIGQGNHEATAEKHNSVNAVRLLLDRLEYPITYGGYSGFIAYRVGGSKAHRFVIHYHHGSGRGEAKAFFRKLHSSADADLLWVGHRHDRVTDGLARWECPLGGKEVRCKITRCAMSGSYLKAGQAGVLQYGEERMLGPQDVGCIRVVLSEKNHKLITELRA